MKRILFLLIFSLKVYSSDELWEKASKIVNSSQNLIPAITETESKILNTKGEVLNTGFFLYENYIDEKGGIKTKLVKAVRDGKDITKEILEEEKIEKRKEKENKKSFELSDFDIFNPKEPKNLKIQREKEEIIGNKIYVLYKFTYKIDKNLIQGRAYIESEEGIPSKIIYTINPLPMGVKSMETLTSYEKDEKGYVLIKKIETKGNASFLFFKRSFEINIKFRDYFEYKKN